MAFGRLLWYAWTDKESEKTRFIFRRAYNVPMTFTIPGVWIELGDDWWDMDGCLDGLAVFNHILVYRH